MVVGRVRVELLGEVKRCWEVGGRRVRVALLDWHSMPTGWNGSGRPPLKRDCLRDRAVPHPVPLQIPSRGDARLCDRLRCRPGHFVAVGGGPGAPALWG